MNIGALDTYVAVYSTNRVADGFGSYKFTDANFIDNCWLKKIPIKSFMKSEAESSRVNENTFEFIARYNTQLIRAGYYFIISGSSTKYYIKGVEEIGRREGLKIYAESKITGA